MARQLASRIRLQTNEPVGIGTFVHEFGHVLGLADHYNNGSTSSYGYTNNVGNWDLMASGSYNDNQNCPPTFSAFERYSLGWTTPTELSATANSLVRMTPYEDNGQCYRISVPNYDNEYFLIEDRQQKSWDAYLPGHGILVWHIDEDPDLWYENKPNADASHQHVDIVEAARILSATGTANDPFPGASNIRSYNFTSWDYKNIFGFVWVDEDETGNTSFILANSDYRLQSPEVSVDSIMGTSARVVWGKSDLATAYNVMLYHDGKYVDNVQTTAPGSQLFTGLTPETAYTARVVSTLSSVRSDTVSVDFTTLPLQIEERKPEVLPATAVTRNSFTAQWRAVPDADSYRVCVYTSNRDGVGKIGTGFDNFTTSMPGLPEGWSVTHGQGRSYTDYGAAAPSIRLRADSSRLVASIPGNKIDSVSFWHCASTAGLILSVDRYADGVWKNVWQYSSDKKRHLTDRLFVDNADSVRFVLTREDGVTTGYQLLDDVYLTYRYNTYHLVKTVVTTESGAQPFTTAKDGLTLGYTINGLSADSLYAYSVQALLGDRLSIMSDTIDVDTTGIVDALVSPTAYPAEHAPATVYDLQGRQVATLLSGQCPSAVLSKGVYVIKGKKFVVK